MKQLIDRLYEIIQQGDIFWNDSAKAILLYCSWLIECMDLPRGGREGVENYSADSDYRGKYDVNETADRQIEWNKPTRRHFWNDCVK